jgi:hypothetical protein
MYPHHPDTGHWKRGDGDWIDLLNLFVEVFEDESHPNRSATEKSMRIYEHQI